MVLKLTPEERQFGDILIGGYAIYHNLISNGPKIEP